MKSDVVDPGAGARLRRRRRRWSAEEKQQIVAESFQPGASLAEVARRHDVNANLVFTWRRQAGGEPAPENSIELVPVSIDWRMPQKTWRPTAAG